MPDGAGPDGLLPLAVRGLRFETGGRTLINTIDCTIARGTLTAVMGPNGAGKSLLLRLLHGLIEPTGGTISWNGHSPGDAVRRRQGMVFQRPVLLRRTTAANLDFVLRLRGGRNEALRDEWLERVGLAHRAAVPARSLSGGEQQRLALARALVLRPEVLFLDEPTASLDPASTASIEKIMRNAMGDGLTALWVTHDPGQAKRLASDVLFLHHGRVCEHTPAAAFFERPRSEEARAFIEGRIVL